MDTPIALFAFNRAGTTTRVFNAIREARPQTLFLVCDGPRPQRPNECDEVRKIFETIDWPCDVRTNFAAENMGCRRRMISGISWVFSQVPAAILLEDDCLPSASFFPFASEMLARFRDDPRVMMVGGFNPFFRRLELRHSYISCRSTSIWGWATWARAWESYDEHLTDWPRLRETPWLSETLGDKGQVKFWRAMLDLVHNGMGSWDWQWTYSVWSKNGLAIVPSRNLVANIGFDSQGSSGVNAGDVPWLKELLSAPLCEMDFPLDHPPRIAIDRKFDTLFFDLAWAPQLPEFTPGSRASRAWMDIKRGDFRSLAKKVVRRLKI